MALAKAPAAPRFNTAIDGVQAFAGCGMTRSTEVAKMKWWCVQALTVLVLLFCIQLTEARAEDIYVAQSAAGGDTGTDCADAHSLAWLNTSGNWGAGSNKVSAGDTVHLCGTLTSILTSQSSGSTGNPTTILFESGAKFSAPYFGSEFVGAINLVGKSNIVVNGGTDGKIENTDNGTAKTYQNASCGIFLANCSNIEVKSLTITNIYQNGGSSSNATDIGGDLTADVYLYQNNTNISVHNCNLLNARKGVWVAFDGANIDSINIYSNLVADHCWSIAVGSGTYPCSSTNIKIHDNEITDWLNWQCPSSSAYCTSSIDAYHTDGLMLFTHHSSTFTPMVYNNYFHGSLGKGSATAFIYLTSDTGANPALGTVFNNLLVYTNTDHCAWFIAGGGAQQIYNNTLVGGSGSCGTALMLSSNAIVMNNIIANANVGIGSYGPLDAIHSDYNVWFNIYGGAGRFSANDGSTWYWFNNGTWQALGYDVHSTTNNPNLDVSYHLQSGSPAVATGTNLTALGISELSKDKSGNPRSSTAPWDIGAFGSTPKTPRIFLLK